MSTTQPKRRVESLQGGWEFRKEGEAWRSVELPHCPFEVDLDGNEHWQGFCEYRRKLRVADPTPGSRYCLHVGAAMHSATVFIDGEFQARHKGGYLPFEIDLTSKLASGAEKELLIVLDNRDDSDVPPGKSLDDLDFCWYGGLYRNVELRMYPDIHFTSAISANEVAGGGVFLRTLSASGRKALVSVRAQVANWSDRSVAVRMRVEAFFESKLIGRVETNLMEIATQGSLHFEAEIHLDKAPLWSPVAPHLIDFRVNALSASGDSLDEVVERFGVRRVEMTRSGGLRINGQRFRPRGTNRHQDYPRVGYALSDAAQYRDAKRIKEAGFDYVRLSHYPQSPAFLSACDELGILVMNCLVGWQFMGGEAFRQACYENARQMIRRDRNHASVILWELSLNETEMDESFVETLQAIGREEYPGDQMYTCGWVDCYDVFIHSRQHGKIHSWKNGEKALVVAEYGDWEFYASNDGFDQKTGEGLLADWSNSRGFRSHGEGKMLQQAKNHELALADTLKSPAICDGVWSMFDYPRGYNPTRAACGVMDFFRLPKYSYYFYRSQRDPEETSELWSGGPMAYIASRWTERSSLDVYVYSNCESVELRLNGKAIGIQSSDTAKIGSNLPHPPLVFHLETFEAGSLEAVGLIGGKPCATHCVTTPGRPARIDLSVDDGGFAGERELGDLLFAHARLKDERGQLCQQDESLVRFWTEGDAAIEGPQEIEAEAGIASVLVRRFAGGCSFRLFAEVPGFRVAEVEYSLARGDDSREKAGTIA